MGKFSGMRIIDWDKVERDEVTRQERSLRALVNVQDIIKTAAESIAHWNRLYREQSREIAIEELTKKERRARV